MNLRMTKDEFHELIMVYLVELSEKEGKMLNEGVKIHSPLFDYFLKWIHNKTLGDLRFSYNKTSGKTKLDYKKMVEKIQKVDNVILYM